EIEAVHAVKALQASFQSERRLKLIDHIHAHKHIALIAVVGLGMRGRPGIAARTFSALSGHNVNVVAIAQGSSELNITIAIADRSGIRIEEDGFSAAALQRLANHKAAGGKLFDRTSPLSLHQLTAMMREELWLLPSHRPILVDLTSEETAPLLQEALERGFHVVLANKKPLAVPQIEYDRLFETARERGLSIRYEATAGAGLPVLDTIAKLQEAGDRVHKIVGC